MKLHFYFLLILFFLSISQAKAQSALDVILPTPSNAVWDGQSYLTEAKLSADQIKVIGNCEIETALFKDWFTANCPATCQGLNETIAIEFNAAKTEFKPGGYLLRISSRGVKIESNGAEGMAYGIQTLKQLLWASFQQNKTKTMIPMVTVQDAPVFPHRGLLLDCGRHFMDVATVKKYIDALAYYKMNVLHWHLTEDQGWRIEIKKYPKLTEIGAWRYDHQLNKYGGFYTQEEIKDIVAYAEARHVTIIPEIELPGHSVAALASYPWLGCLDKNISVETEWGVFKDIYCAGNDNTMKFIQHVMDEVCMLFPGKYIHIGGDEAPKFRWENCDKCQKRMHDHNLKSEAELQTWFIEEIAKYLSGKGKQIIGWDEILEGGIPADALIQSWRGMEGGIAAAKLKHGVIMSPTSHCYIDYPLSSINLEKVYSFNPVPATCSAEEAKYILGAEVNMWTEHAPQEVVDTKVFPRMLALSEVLWNAPKIRNYELFYGKVKQQYTALQNMHIKYGFPDTPISIRSEVNKDHQVAVRVLTYSSDVRVNYRTPSMESAMKWEDTLLVEGMQPIRFIYKLGSDGEIFEEERVFSSNYATGRPLTLNYTPSVYYTGGGVNALVDGRLGTLNFRDGIWQAVQGQDMEMVIDLEEVRQIEHISTNWFHYANAWIFRPETVRCWVSLDGKKWSVFGDWKAEISADKSGELLVHVGGGIGQVFAARYVKIQAQSIGKCPEWHDAVGEPSWLFCDEIVVE